MSIEDTTNTKYKNKSVERYFITVPSDTKIYDKGYYVLKGEGNKILKTQQLSDKELALQLVNHKDEDK